MELPHLVMYTRRVLASPARLPLRDALRTARVRALLGILGWVVLSCAYLAFYLSGALDTQLAAVQSGIVVLAVWYLLFGLAEQMYALVPARSAAQPDWQLTPLGSREAVFGLALSALLGSLPVLAGLALFLLCDPSQIYNGSYLLPSFSLSQLGLLVLRLPLFCLASASIMLLARDLRVSRLTPWLLATAGAAAVLWRFDPAPVDIVNFSTPELITPGPMSFLLAGLLLLLLMWSCYRASSRDHFTVLPALTLLLLLASPLALGLSALGWAAEISISQNSSSHSSLANDAMVARLSGYHYGLGTFAAPVFFAFGMVYPGLTAGDWTSYSLSSLQPQGAGSALFLVNSELAAASLLATALWFVCCCACLDAVRGRRKVPARAASPDRRL